MFLQIVTLVGIGLFGPALLLFGGMAFALRGEREGGISASMIAGVVMWALVILGGTPICYNQFRHQVLTYHEDLNTVVLAVQKVPTVCGEDGSCIWTYKCHPYTVMEKYQAPEYYQDYDSKKKQYVTKKRTVPKLRPVVKYHLCPYSAEEDTWVTVTALKENLNGDPTSPNQTLIEASHRLPDHPYDHLWYEQSFIPSGVLDAAGVGEPPVSLRYEALLREGVYPAITLSHGYLNFVLSDPDTTMRPTVPQDILAPYQTKHLLPPLQITPDTSRSVNKVSFVGMSPPANAMQWQEALNQFNAEAGTLRQVDMHLVVLPDNVVGDLHQYALALRGYWSDTQTFGKNALPKNALVLVLTTDGQAVRRAEAFTLLPASADGVSNTYLFQHIQQDLVGVPLQPARLLGAPHPIVTKEDSARYGVKYEALAQSGILEQLLLFGPDHFRRVPMSSFRYLEDEILPSTGDCVAIVLIMFGIGLALSCCVIALGRKLREA